MSDVELSEDFIWACVENHAQLIRFVQRKNMTSMEAAKLSVDHAQALMQEMASRAVDIAESCKNPEEQN